MSGLLDVILHYDCNLACDYCTITPAMRARGLATAAVLRELTSARADGYDRLSITGGEPVQWLVLSGDQTFVVDGATGRFVRREKD